MSRKKNNDHPNSPKDRIRDIAPPENYRKMIDKNVSLTKVMIDIFDLYSGVVAGSASKENSKNKESNL